MKTTTAVVLTTLVALTVLHCTVADVIYMDADTSVSKNPYGLARRPKQNSGGTVCSEKNPYTQSECDDTDECEWSNGHCGCKYVVGVRRCLNGKLTELYYPKTTNITLASTERANNKTWTHSRTSELNLWANCVKLSHWYNMLPVSNLYVEPGETGTNRYYYKTLDCTGIDDYEKPVTRVYNDSLCVNLIKTASNIVSNNAYLPSEKGKYYCPREEETDPKAMCSTNAACGTLSSTLTPGCETEAGCTSSTLSASFEFEKWGTETCTWANSKCGCPSGAYRQIICYNNTQFDVVWNTSEGCLNGTSAGLSNVITSRKVTDEDLTKCESDGSMINGTSYNSRRHGVCQGRPDFTPPFTVFYTGSGCSGTAFNAPGYQQDRKDTGKCVCAASAKKEVCVPRTFTCDGNGGLTTKTYASPEKFSSSSMCAGTPQSTSTTNTKVANDWANEHAFTLDTCEMNPAGTYAIQFTCIGVPAGYSPISYAKGGTSCPSGGVNASNKDHDNGNSSSLYCACLSSTSPSPAPSASPSPASSTSPSPASSSTSPSPNPASTATLGAGMRASVSMMAAGVMILFTGYLNA